MGLQFASCLHCFFDMQRAIAERHAAYQRAYGVVPSFKAGAHRGQVTTVLVGTQHWELVYHGDVLNTTRAFRLSAMHWAAGFWSPPSCAGNWVSSRNFSLPPLADRYFVEKLVPPSCSTCSSTGLF